MVRRERGRRARAPVYARVRCACLLGQNFFFSFLFFYLFFFTETFWENKNRIDDEMK